MRRATYEDVEDREEVAQDHHNRDLNLGVEHLLERGDEFVLLPLGVQSIETIVEACGVHSTILRKP